MSGTRIGGLKAAAKNLARDPLFYKIIGAKGGANGYGSAKGFASELVDKNGMTGFERASVAGKKGGSISRGGGRRKVVSND